MANPSSPNGGHTGIDAARRDMGATKETAHEDPGEIKRCATDDLDAVKREAQDEFDHVRREAGGHAEGQRNQAADQISGIASAFGRVGDELRSGEQSRAGHYAANRPTGARMWPTEPETAALARTIIRSPRSGAGKAYSDAKGAVRQGADTAKAEASKATGNRGRHEPPN